MPELLKRAEQLLKDDAKLELIVRKTQETAGFEEMADSLKRYLVSTLKNYIAEEAHPTAPQVSSWQCIERSRENHRKNRGSFRRKEIELFFDSIDRSGSILPESLSRHPTKNYFAIPLLEKERTSFQYKRSSRLTAYQQNLLLNEGVSEQIFEQLDDVLLEDYRPVKYFSGQGGFGVVTLVEDRNGRCVVLKKIPLDSDSKLIELKNILHIREMIKSYNHVVQIFEAGVDVEFFEDSITTYAFYTMEAADDLNAMCPDAYGWYQPFTLDYLLKKQEYRWDRRRFAFLFTAFFEIILGVTKLHINELIHRDLKPGNIAIFNGKAKIIDLGLMTSVSKENFVGGTQFFCPEEVLKKQRSQTQGDDVYALGKLLYSLLTLLPPEKYPEYPVGWPEEESLRKAKKLIERACSPNIKRRYKSAKEFLIHFMDTFDIDLEKSLTVPMLSTD